MEAKWIVCAKKADFKAIGEKFNIDQVVARVIRNRDIEGDEAISKFLYGTLNDTYSPDSMADIKQGAEIISDAIKNGEHIRIVSDYDVDGVMSNYILLEGLCSLGANVSYEIPDRMADGYGINERIIMDAHQDNVNTIITCDNGIAAFEAIELAKSYGMKVVVTDHHEVPYEIDSEGKRIYNLVPADAVIDIKREDCNYPFKELCGAGVAYKFLRYLYTYMGVPWKDQTRFIDMVAIATQCDVMELRDENRIYVKEGLKLIEKTNNTGLKALLRANGLEGKKILSYHLGFVIGPCINATGRLESAKRGLRLLLSQDEQEAEVIARELLELNVARKAMTNEGIEEAIALAKDKYEENKVLVIYLPELHESIAGIVAGKVREAVYKPVLILTNGEGGIVKGSGRSIEAYHMYDALTEVKDIFIKYGGHTMAAGFSLPKEKVDELRERLNANQRLTEEDLTPVVRLDVPMPISYISENIVRELELLEPFGKGNEKPVFGQSALGVQRVRYIGKDNQYVRIIFQDENGYTVEGIDFNGKHFTECIKKWFSEEECVKMFKGIPNKVKLDVAYYPDVNEYMGRCTVQIRPTMYRKTNTEEM